jgi:hypothetical protein
LPGGCRQAACWARQLQHCLLLLPLLLLQVLLATCWRALSPTTLLLLLLLLLVVLLLCSRVSTCATAQRTLHRSLYQLLLLLRQFQLHWGNSSWHSSSSSSSSSSSRAGTCIRLTGQHLLQARLRLQLQHPSDLHERHYLISHQRAHDLPDLVADQL